MQAMREAGPARSDGAEGRGGHAHRRSWNVTGASPPSLPRSTGAGQDRRQLCQHDPRAVLSDRHAAHALRCEVRAGERCIIGALSTCECVIGHIFFSRK